MSYLQFFSKKRCLTYLLCLIAFSLIVTNHFSNFLLRQYEELLKLSVPTAKRYTFTTKPTKRALKTILYWNTFFEQEDFYFGFGQEIFQSCPISSCFATKNKSLVPIEQFDSIIFHGARYSVFKDSIPKCRSVHQKYIFLSFESPYNTRFDKTITKNFYNWTMTYRRDSDIHYPYGIVQEIYSNYTLPSWEKICTKTRTVAWFVSNCNTKGTSRRLKYAKELQKYIDLDIYGKCGNLSCPHGEKKCYEMLEKDYYFYLSFENSLCADYVTEKLFKVLDYNVVPIVLGNADYSTIAPPRSVINVNDFDDPATLANYLQQLLSNPEEYTQYFEWKKHFGVSKSQEYALCQLCELLHAPSNYSSYEDIEDWFYGFKCVI